MSAAATRLSIVPAPAWLSADEVMQRMRWSRPTFFRRKAQIISRPAGKNDANGRPVMEYLEASLPHSPEPPAALTIVPPATFLGPLFNQETVELPRETLPDPDDDAQAKKRFNLILPILTYSSDPERWRALRLADGKPVTSKSRLVVYVAETNEQSVATIKRYLQRYRDGGLAALADKQRSDKGKSRWAHQSETTIELAELAAYAHLREDLSIHMAWEILECRGRQLGMAAPSYQTVRRILANINPAAIVLSKQGRKTYDQIFAPYISREFSMGAGEIVVSDHMIHDVFVQDDVFGGCDRRAIRLRFTGLLDMRSRRFTAYAWSQEGSSRSITTVLRYHYERYGRFRQFYCDNGKDYQKTGRGASGSTWDMEEIPPEALGVVARLGAEIKYCIKFHPQSKLIERANNTIHMRFDRRWASYCGKDPQHRPEQCDKLLARHAKLLAEGRVEESDLPLASEFIRAAVAWIEGEYHRKSKDIEGMENITPLEAWEEFRWADAGEPVDPALLVPLLSSRARRTIRRGRIEIGDEIYTAADPESAIQLHDRGVAGNSCLVLYDEQDPSFIAAADDDGRVFAFLKPLTLLRQSDDEETRAGIAASMEQRGHLRKRTSQQLKDLEQRVLATGYVPQKDQMLAIGQLPIPIDGLVVHRPGRRLALRPDKTAQAPASASDIAASFLEELK
jgi:putative transposase